MSATLFHSQFEEFGKLISLIRWETTVWSKRSTFSTLFSLLRFHFQTHFSSFCYLLLMTFQLSCVGYKKQKKHKNLFIKIYDCLTSAQWHFFHFEVCKVATFRAGSNQLAHWESSAGTSIDYRKLHLLTKHRLIFVFKQTPQKACFCWNLSYIKRGSEFCNSCLIFLFKTWFCGATINLAITIMSVIVSLSSKCQERGIVFFSSLLDR